MYIDPSQPRTIIDTGLARPLVQPQAQPQSFPGQRMPMFGGMLRNLMAQRQQVQPEMSEQHGGGLARLAMQFGRGVFR